MQCKLDILMAMIVVDLQIATLWKSFDQLNILHTDHVFKEKFDQLADYATESYEINYEMLWQGEPE